MDDEVLKTSKASSKVVVRPTLSESFDSWWAENVHNTRFSKNTKKLAAAIRLKAQLKQLFEGDR